MKKAFIIAILAIFIAGAGFSKGENKKKSKGDAFMDDDLKKTDGEFIETFRAFSDDEVGEYLKGRLTKNEETLCAIASLMGCDGKSEFREQLTRALNNKWVTGPEVKELIYQATAYLGFGIAREFLNVANNAFKECGLPFITENKKTVTADNRLEIGNEKQVTFFGDGIRHSWESAPPDTAHINKWLADNCFGDYYTRKGLSDNSREMLTFCYLASLGCAKSQLEAHTKANIKVGNDKKRLTAIVSAMIPYIGYPKSLNALNVINDATKE